MDTWTRRPVDDPIASVIRIGAIVMRQMMVIFFLCVAGAANGMDRGAAGLRTSTAYVEDDGSSEDASGGSLGIGFDVFPQAFGFAAGRVGAIPDLTIVSCKGLRCAYRLGAGVTVSTDHLPEKLDMHRVEASLDGRRSRDPAARFEFERACLTIVYLVDPNATRDEQMATATAISASPIQTVRRFRLGTLERGIRVYGAETIGAATTSTALRCGAVAAP